MNCDDYEKLIYTFRELKPEERNKVKQHIATCERCQKLLNEVESFSQVVKSINQESLNTTPPPHLVNNVMEFINVKDETKKVNSYSLLSYSTIRYALAAVSCGILVLFFVEILVPDLKSGKIKGPLTAVQGAIIKSEDFRKAFAKPKEKSLFEDCKNILSQQVDANCVREKLDKINF